MKADTLVASSSAVAAADFLKPVLTPAGNTPTATSGGLAASGPGTGSAGSTGGGPPPGPELALNVECGPNKAWFYVGRLCQGSKGPCVLFNGAWLTPNEFQYVSGRETAKDWKRSIRHHGKSMKLLMTKGILVITPQPLCQCDVCTGRAENNNNLDVNKRAAEIASRKAAQEAAAAAAALDVNIVKPPGATPVGDLPAGHLATGSNTTAPLTVGVDDRLTDPDAANDQNSPAKESRLTNIIEAIKSKKKKDDGSTDSSAQKENRPNSRPSSRAGCKKKKENTTENGVASPVEESNTSQSSQHSPGGNASATLDIGHVTRPDMSLYPNNNSSSSSSSISSSSSPPRDSLRAAITSGNEASSLTQQQSSASDSAESDTETSDEAPPSDVSRTRGFDWSLRKSAKLTPEQRAALMAAAPQPTLPQAPQLPATGSDSALLSPTSGSTDHHLNLSSHIRSLEGGRQHEASGSSSSEGLLQAAISPSAAPWSPAISVSKVVSGTDSKPPLLSASRSITTATSCITKPIVSTGSSMLTSAMPKDQRDVGKEGGEPSRVYAPINWPPVASEVNSDAKSSSDQTNRTSTNSESKTDSSSSRQSVDPPKASPSTPEKAHASTNGSGGSEDRGRPSPPTPKVGLKASEAPPAGASNYSDYLRQLGRVPGAPPPGMDDETYLAMMRRYYEWQYEMSRLYGPYAAMQPGAAPPPTAGLPRPPLQPHHPGAYDQHSFLSMYSPYYAAAYAAHPAAGDHYRAALQAASALPQEWARLSTLSEQEREALMARQRAAAEAAQQQGGSGEPRLAGETSDARTGSPLKRAYPGADQEALDLSVNKKQKLAESLAAARDPTALLYGLHAASGFRHPATAQFPAGMAGVPTAAAYPAGVGSLELAAAAYPGLWGLPHTHPGASLTHAGISTTASALSAAHHPGLAAYVSQHHLAARPGVTTASTASSTASTIHKDLLHAAASHRPEGPSLGLAGAWR